jgi:Fe-S cluster biogenesis protein NfuA/nitrite reductase/ring-hydroxylating ferredoxin subunit
MARTISASELAMGIQEGLASLQRELSPQTYAAVEELVASILAFYGTGIERLLTLLAEHVPNSDAVLRILASDPLVAALLIVHELHPLSVEQRVELALDRVRPYLRSHGGGVELVQIDADGVAHLRLHGTCHGCPASLLTVRLSIERAIEELAPEVVRVEVEGLADTFDKPPSVISPLGSTVPAPSAWQPLGLDMLESGQCQVLELEGVSVLVCRLGAQVYAYVNTCPRCGGRLEGAALEGHSLRCLMCQTAYHVRLAGRTLDGSPYYLTPLPVIQENSTWMIALPLNR